MGLVVGRLGLVVGLLLPVVGLLIGGARWDHDAHHNVANHAGECSKEDREQHVAQSHECGVDFKIFSHAAEHTAEGFVGRGFVKFFSSVSHFFYRFSLLIFLLIVVKVVLFQPLYMN